MQKIICHDVKGKKYPVNASALTKRISVYGVHIKDGLVLLTKDKVANQWEVPGGGLEEGEEEISTLQREAMEETGLEISHEVALVTQRQEYFYSLYSNRAFDSHRKFYVIRQVIGGELLPDGNGWDTIAAKYVPFKEIEAFSSNEMKDVYKEVIKQALET